MIVLRSEQILNAGGSKIKLDAVISSKNYSIEASSRSILVENVESGKRVELNSWKELAWIFNTKIATEIHDFYIQLFARGSYIRDEDELIAVKELIAFRQQAIKLLASWNHEALTEAYPFHESYDELIDSIGVWTSISKMNFERGQQ